MSKSKELKVADIFSGVGGLGLGCARAGFNIVASIDSDPHASLAHKINFPHCNHSSEDIQKLTGKEIRFLCGLADKDTLDGIIGGPPCQGFSSIGKQDPKDTRNSLFKYFFEIVRQIQPKFFLAENVPGIMDEKFRHIRKAANVPGYTILKPLVLKASDFGAPTSRQRVFFIGYKAAFFTTLKTTDFTPPSNTEIVNVRKALMGLRGKVSCSDDFDKHKWRTIEKSIKGPYGRRVYGLIPNKIGWKDAIKKLKDKNQVTGCIGTQHSPNITARYGSLSPGEKDAVSRSVRLDWDKFCPTLRAGTASDRGSYQAVRPIHPVEARVITPREAARLQGFPDWFTFSSTKWHSFRQIGNSVSPILSEKIFRIILSHYKKNA